MIEQAWIVFVHLWHWWVIVFLGVLLAVAREKETGVPGVVPVVLGGIISVAIFSYYFNSHLEGHALVTHLEKEFKEIVADSSEKAYALRDFKRKRPPAPGELHELVRRRNILLYDNGFCLSDPWWMHQDTGEDPVAWTRSFYYKCQYYGDGV